ncbi:AAA family ATPase [Bacillus smithii]|uniref:AAA family ATPase n=1 Tax=Bacillus smithii TaxID=1479 RepID=UPI0030C90CF0
MRINFETLTLQNFKSHRDLSVTFGERTQITGDNAKGKSSIFEAITWLLYGVDAVGSKLDPTPITYEAEETLVSLLIKIDEKNVLLGRGLKKGKATYYINEVPSKAKEFSELIDSLFDKELFLSLFNPSYFFTLHWEKQRAMLLQYVSAPANKEVLKHMPDEQAKFLERLLKKHSLDDLEKIHRENKNKKDKDYIAAQSRTKTLQEQLEKLEKPNLDIDSLKAEVSHITIQIQEIGKVTESAGETNRKINTLQTRIQSLLSERDRMKKDFQILKNEPIEDTCRVCKQPLQDESLKAAEEDKQRRIQEFKAHYDQVVAQRKELEAELAQLEYIDVSEQLEKIRELEQKRESLLHDIRNYEQYEELETQVKSAAADENATLQALKASIFVLDSIKAFRAKEAEIQAEKVQGFFENLSIKLFEQLKNGEIKPTFEIEMDGKPYRKLSLSEGIRAGLELRDVLSQQSGVITPVFVDNAESITSFKEPVGQLIISKVVAGQELKIEKEDAE